MLQDYDTVEQCFHRLFQIIPVRAVFPQDVCNVGETEDGRAVLDVHITTELEDLVDCLVSLAVEDGVEDDI